MQTGEQLKAEVLAITLVAASPNWRAAAMAALASMQGEFTAEDVRLACAEGGVYAHHPNAWGAFFSHVLKAGHIEPTGALRPMKAPRSHARQTMVYRKTAS